MAFEIQKPYFGLPTNSYYQMQQGQSEDTNHFNLSYNIQQPSFSNATQINTHWAADIYKNKIDQRRRDFNGNMQEIIKLPSQQQEFSPSQYGLIDYGQQFQDKNNPITQQLNLKTGLTLSQSKDSITSLLGKSELKDSTDSLVKEVPLPEKMSFSDKFNNSTFGKNFGTWSVGLDMGNQVLEGVLGPKSEYGGQKGQLTQTIDAAYDKISDAIGNIPVWGQMASLIMKGGRMLGTPINKLGGGTDGMTKKDAILGSAFLNLTPVGLINGFGGKTTDALTKNDLAFENVGASYTGSNASVDTAVGKAGKKYGLFSESDRQFANQQIAEARRQQNIISDISDRAMDSFNISSSMAAINNNRRALAMQGGYDQSAIRAAKHGMSIEYPQPVVNNFQQENIKELTLQDIPKEYLEPMNIIEEITLDSIPPEFKEGGTLAKKIRTLDELIEYAKQENPRFIQRMSEPVRDVDLGDEFRGTHRLSWGTTDNPNEAIVYPEIFENEKGELVYDPEHAFDNARKGDALLMTLEEAEIFTKGYKQGWPQFFQKFAEGGKVNVIPEGALHARLHHMENADNLTKKGIPVVAEKEGGELEQQAEIEREEIIFRLEVTKKLEELLKKYSDDEASQKDKDSVAIEAGKLLVEEILNNTIDNTNNLL